MELKKDYKVYLSKVAKQMILIHDATLLSRLVVRTLTRKIAIRHAGLFLYNKNKQEYIIHVSSGKRGLKIPVGFTKITKNNPVIKFFLNKEISANKDFLSLSQILQLKKRNENDKKLFDFFSKLEEEFSLYKANIIVPGFFRKDLTVLFIIGDKEDSSPFTEDDMDFLTVLSSDVVMAIQNAKLFEDIKHQLDENKRLLLILILTDITKG